MSRWQLAPCPIRVEAARQINELKGSEGVLVASRIADRSGITRSVIVNALRKLESAGIIETRSLGMKGTHIKILNKNSSRIRKNLIWVTKNPSLS